MCRALDPISVSVERSGKVNIIFQDTPSRERFVCESVTYVYV